MSDEGLYAELSPENREAFLVLADALQERGDPRGELIAVQRALETASVQDSAELRRREGEVLIANTATWLPIDPPVRKRIAVRWRDGFVDRARVVGDHEALASLLAAPYVGSTLTELRILDPHGNMNQLLEALCAAWPASLRRLILNDGRLAMFGPSVALKQLRAHASRLEHLVVRGQRVDLVWKDPPPALRHLEIHAGQFEWSSFGSFAWPAIEELVIWTTSIDLGELARFPNLRVLGLCGTENTDELVTRLLAWPGLARLRELSLDGGTLTADGARALAPLEIPIDLRRNLITGAKELERATWRVRPQRKGSRSLGDAGEATALYAKLTELTRTSLPAGNEAEKRHRKTAAAAVLVAPAVEIYGRFAIAVRLPEPNTRREAIRELVAAADAALEIDGMTAGILLALGNECDGLDDLFEAEAWIWQALREARWFGDASTEHRAAGQIATLRMRRGDPNTAAPILERVEAYFRKTEQKSNEAWAIRQRGNVELTRSNFAAAEPLYRKALEIYKQLDDKKAQGIVLSELSSAYWARSDLAGAEKMLREAIALKANDEDELGLASTYANLAAILNGANRIDESIAAAKKALELFEARNHQGGQGQALSLLGELLQRKNDHAGAMKLLDRAIVIFRAAGRMRELGVALGNVSRVALDNGDWAKARACCEEAVECHREVGNKYNEGMQLMGLGDAAIGEGDLAAAEQFLVEALVPLQAIKNFPGIAAVHHRRGIAAQLGGDPKLATKHFKQAMADATRGNWIELHGWSEMWIALIAAQAGDAKAAREALKRARAALPQSSIQGNETLLMATSVVSQLGGGQVKLPKPLSWDSRIIATLSSKPGRSRTRP